jgi:hypothetical protein
MNKEKGQDGSHSAKLSCRREGRVGAKITKAKSVGLLQYCIVRRGLVPRTVGAEHERGDGETYRGVLWH